MKGFSKASFSIFGMSMFDMSEDKFLKSEHYDVFTFGRPPVCIEILNAVKGLEFESTYSRSVIQNFDGIDVRMIDIRDLITTKKSVNRNKDKDDLEHLDNSHN